ncbi:receptor [Cichlidogyrus casuarinus]|uniref:Receptor n=1 Tax=Cichlidogyrus casuarinus TaxID=1844966 RepID=A0ABD2Q784_9PLAT
MNQKRAYCSTIAASIAGPNFDIELLKDIVDNCSDFISPDLLSNFIVDQKFPIYYWFLIYVGMIIFGTIGNFLVILISVRNRSIRQSPRNLFILNLAISDFLLCLVTQPLNLLKSFSEGESSQLNTDSSFCKISTIIQGANIFVSSFSIIAIALDRYYASLQIFRFHSLGSSPTLYFMKISSRIFFYRNEEGAIKSKLKPVCSENSDNNTETIVRLTYTISCMLIQYLLPLTVVIYANVRIAIKIRQRTLHMERLKARYQVAIRKDITFNNTSSALPVDNDHQKQVGSAANSTRREKQAPMSRVSCVENLKNLTNHHESHYRKNPRRASILLANIVVVFAMSWLPLNLYNLVLDLRNLLNLRQNLRPGEQRLSFSKSGVHAVQYACLLIVSASACLNPILYGWLNENFREGFRRIFKSIKCQSNSLRKSLRIRKSTEGLSFN